MGELERDWQDWRAGRRAEVTAPGGPLSLTGTHWVTEQGEVPGLPGLWSPAPDGVTLKTTAGDGFRRTGRPLEGTVALTPGDPLDLDGRTVAVIVREGEPAVRVYDPAAAALRAFEEIEVFGHDPSWRRPAAFTAYRRSRQEIVDNADGNRRGLSLAGRVAFDGGELAVSRDEEDGSLSAVFGDASNGPDTFRFRFIDLPAPDATGATVIDFNRAYLPPCAFAAHFLCPFPPPGNVLRAAVEAGEKRVRTR